MSSNIQYLIDVIKREIPIEVLRMIFEPPELLGILKPSLDHLIKSEVLYNWVRTDTNLVAGEETMVDITGSKIEYVNMGMIVHVGMGPTAGRKITSVLSVGYGYNALAGGQPSITSALIEPLQTSDARLQLVGENIVYVEGYTGVYLTNLRCILENQKDFTNVNARALVSLSELCLLAAKAYIYNKFRLRLPNAVVVRGIDMAAVSEVISGYSEAATEYREMLKNKWVKINALSDRVTHSRHIRRSIPSW